MSDVKIWIHAARPLVHAPVPSGRVAVIHSFLQSALVLADPGRIRPADTRSVLQDIRRQGIAETQVQAWLEDAMTRLAVSSSWLEWAQ